MELEFSKEASMLRQRLQSQGFETCFVGGAVRDALLGRSCDDVDLATAALPEQVREVFYDLPVIETGMKHGTVTVIADGTPVEITTYRVETTYTDSRHPDRVLFTRKLEDDLARRDFTVNAMAYSEERGLVDPFGGQADLQAGILRCVGDPAMRFEEDALRILRLLRFACVLGFSIEENTAKAAFAAREGLRLLSAERIQAEVKKLLCGKNVRAVLCGYWKILAEVFPFLSAMHGFDQQNEHHCFDVLEHTAAVVEAIEPLPRLRLAAFFHDCGKPACFSLDENGIGHFYGHAAVSAKEAFNAMERLKFDRATQTRVELLVKIHDTPLQADERLLKRRLNQYGEEALRDLLALQRADNFGQAPKVSGQQKAFDEIEALLDAVCSKQSCFSVRALAVNGNDLKEIGYHGRGIGQALRLLLDAVIDEKVPNEKEALLSFLKEAKK